jgi:hypothetical protein
MKRFFDRFLKNFQILNFMKMYPVLTGLFHADRERDKQADLQPDRQTDSHYNIWPLMVFILVRILFSSYELRPAKTFSQLRQRLKKQLSTESDRL